MEGGTWNSVQGTGGGGAGNGRDGGEDRQRENVGEANEGPTFGITQICT